MVIRNIAKLDFQMASFHVLCRYFPDKMIVQKMRQATARRGISGVDIWTVTRNDELLREMNGIVNEPDVVRKVKEVYLSAARVLYESGIDVCKLELRVPQCIQVGICDDLAERLRVANGTLNDRHGMSLYVER